MFPHITYMIIETPFELQYVEVNCLSWNSHFPQLKLHIIFAPCFDCQQQLIILRTVYLFAGSRYTTIKLKIEVRLNASKLRMFSSVGRALPTETLTGRINSHSNFAQLMFP